MAELEAEVATLLGKPAALFLPSGTMAQQATLRVHADRTGRPGIVFHPACHLDWHEGRGYQRLHGMVGVPAGEIGLPLTRSTLDGINERPAALLIELPQRDLGGTLPAWDDLVAQVEWARERGAAAHMDGARLWEASAGYGRPPAEIAALFDTVYVSFYKGLGGLAGCCIAGPADVVAEVSEWRTRHGGRLYAMWPYAASALTTLRSRLPLMPAYYRHTLAIAEALAGPAGRRGAPQSSAGPDDAPTDRGQPRRAREPGARDRTAPEDLDLRSSIQHGLANPAADRVLDRRRHHGLHPRRGQRSDREASGGALGGRFQFALGDFHRCRGPCLEE